MRKEMIAGKEDILKYIPQRPPVVMVDTLLSCEENFSMTEFTVLHDNLFFENGIFTEAGLMENMAQTAAAKVGYECMLKHVPVPPGFIGAVKNLTVSRFPREGDQIQTTISVENEVFGISLVKGTVTLNGEEIASGEMKILLNRNAA